MDENLDTNIIELKKLGKRTAKKLVVLRNLNNLEENERTDEALGVLISRYCEYEAERILGILEYALADANYDNLAEQILQFRVNLVGETDTEGDAAWGEDINN
ncbi:MAG: hypothetical protein ITD33_02500 [Nitrosarchaeum sp.]|nr:hypothetical protein [Nitrosarchaeum sp.]